MQYVIELSEAEVIVSAALKMQVVGENRDSCNVDFSSERDPASKAFLKCCQLGLKPARLPELRLLLKVDDARIGNSPFRKC